MEAEVPGLSKSLEEIEKADGPIDYLAANHGGYLIEAQGDAQPLTVDWLIFRRRETDLVSTYSEIDLQNLDYTRELIDPYTGNAYKGELVGGVDAGAPGVRLKLTVYDGNREKLLQASGSLVVGESRELAKIDFLAEEKLDPLVVTYAQVDGQAYADFLIDNYLLSLDRPETGLRLPFVPTVKLVRKLMGQEAVDNLRSLTLPIYQGRREMLWDRLLGVERVSPVCAVIPILKILEDRRCRQTHGADCPTYSVMAVYSELLRRYGGSEGEDQKGFRFEEVLDVIQDRGLCQERHYPFLLKAAKENKRDFKKLAKDAERELNGLIGKRRRGEPVLPRYAAFVKTLDEENGGPAQEIRFDDQSLPPLCTAEMERFLREEPVFRDDFIVLYFRDRFGGKNPEEGLEIDIPLTDLLGRGDRSRRLVAAQRRELYLVTLALLERGELVAIGGDAGRIGRHAVLAYGVKPRRRRSGGRPGLVYLESSRRRKDARAGRVLPGSEALDVLRWIAFLRQ